MTNFHRIVWQLLIVLIAGMFSSQLELLAADVRFGTDIVPILSKLGCNGGGCHG